MEDPQVSIKEKTVCYQLPEMNNVKVRRDVDYQPALEMDIYYPPQFESESLPVVVIVAGFPDSGFEKHMGCKFKEMGSVISWAQLIAASGMIAITYVNRDPDVDIHELLKYIRQNANALGINKKRLGVWASSGNVPVALSAILSDELQCAVLCYGYMLDLDGSTSVAQATKMFGFRNPNDGKSLNDFPKNTSLLVVRSGQDQFPGLNETIDRFVDHALAKNLSIALINHPDGTHAFDLEKGSKRSREIIQQILNFLQLELLG